MVLAKLLQAADIRAGDHVLDAGCATGYASAILARLARSVVALEQDPSLARQAEANLRAVGAVNVTVVVGPLTEGSPTGGPYDVILLDGSAEVSPKALLRQLKDGGRLVGVLGRAPATTRHAVSCCWRRMQRPSDLRRRGAAPAWFCAAG